MVSLMKMVKIAILLVVTLFACAGCGNGVEDTRARNVAYCDKVVSVSRVILNNARLGVPQKDQRELMYGVAPIMRQPAFIIFAHSLTEPSPFQKLMEDEMTFAYSAPDDETVKSHYTELLLQCHVQNYTDKYYTYFRKFND